MKLFLIVTVLLASTVHAEPTIGYVSCGYAGSPDSLTGIGDSRAYQMDAYKDKKNEAGVIGDAISIALSPADDKGKLIISPNQVNMISRAANGSTSAEWVNKIASCGKILVPNKVFINVGGNDLISALKEKKGLQGEFNAFLEQEKKEREQEAILQAVTFIVTRRFSANRLLTVRNVLSQGLKLFTTILNKFKAALLKPKPSRIRFPAAESFNFHNFWNWKSDQRVDEVAANMKIVGEHFLNQGAKVLLNTEAPVTLLDPSRESTGGPPTNDDLKTPVLIAENFPEALKLMFNLRMKYVSDVYPYLLNLNTGRIVFVDSYDVFFNNIARSGGSYYLQDGIHFSTLGLLEWGRMMATAMVQSGWYVPGPGYVTPGQPKFYEDSDVHKYHMYTTFKGIENNLPWNVLVDREMQFQERGFAKDFPENGTTLYILKDDNEVFTLSGIMRDKYKQMGEGKGALGFPTGGIYQIHFGTIDRVNFECGYIDHNRLDLLNPNNTSVHITKNECQQ